MKVLVIAIAAVAFSGVAFAQSNGDSDSRRAAAPSTLAEGEVRKVDKEAGKITIKHGPLRNLDMPAMTMVFRVKDPAMLEQIKPGDKIDFRAENVGGALTVAQLEARR
ncbi:MAG: copper-binding protein [Betaproteobacteria bacterium]|nr:copper-binding protein [Betaproteobacteria bacterium]MBI2958806.1 copper-binding protein [Betaproteobacteria bacterium]